MPFRPDLTSTPPRSTALLAIAWTSIRVGTAALLDGPSTFPLPKLGGILAILGASVPPALAEAFIGHLFEVARRGVGGLMLDLDEPESDKAWIRGRMGLVGELIERKSLGDVLREDDMFTNVRAPRPLLSAGARLVRC